MKSSLIHLLSVSVTLAAVTVTSACSSPKALKSGLDPEAFKTDSTALYAISNSKGMEACITNFGARVVSLCVPDSDGNFRDVAVGFGDINSYTANKTSFGALVGPYANRIAGGRFSLDGKDFQLEINNGPNCLHGGNAGWRQRSFDVVEYTENSLTLGIKKPEGALGFPGDVDFTVKYTVTEDNRLDIIYDATTSAPTVLNVTNHSFFNLSGDSSRSIIDNILFVDADCFTPTDEVQIPTGEYRSVEGTPFDFREAKKIGQDIDRDDPQLAAAGGYDHNLILNNPGNDKVICASLYCPESGIRMDVYTDQPGLQVFTANNGNPELVFKDGKPQVGRAAVCLETQHFPDSPNHPSFPTTTLRPGEKFHSHTAYAFSAEK